MPTVEEIVTMRQEADKTCKDLENQIENEKANAKAKISFRKASISSLNEQIRNIEQESDRELDVFRQRRNATATRISRINAVALRPISLSSLKHILPEKFTPTPPWYGHRETCIYSEVMFSTPVAGIVAKIIQTGKPTNRYGYRLSVIPEATVSKYRLKSLVTNYKKETDGILASKDFPSKEAALAYHKKNAYRLYAEAEARINAFCTEISNTPTELSEIFDFRLLRDHDLIEAYYSGADRYTIVSIEKNRLVLKPTDYEARYMGEEYGSHNPLPGEIIVSLDGFDFRIEGASKEKRPRGEHLHVQPYPDYTQIRDALVDAFNLFVERKKDEE